MIGTTFWGHFLGLGGHFFHTPLVTMPETLEEELVNA